MFQKPDVADVDRERREDGGGREVVRYTIHVTPDELERLASSAIIDIHEHVDEMYADGLHYVGGTWSSATLEVHRDQAVDLFDRAIELVRAWEGQQD